MSLSKRHSRLGAFFGALLAATLLAGALSSVAAAICPPSALSSPFAQFGDGAVYQVAPGGSFESGTPGWSLSRASVSGGNETYNAVSGSHSLAIQPSGEAQSPWMCIASEYPSFRFFVRPLSAGASGSLNVSLQWISALGLSIESPAGSVTGGSSWAPSPVMKYGNSLPLWLPGSELAVRLAFRASGAGGWAIDDVFIDPYRR